MNYRGSTTNKQDNFKRKIEIQPPAFSCKGQETSHVVEMREKPGMKRIV